MARASSSVRLCALPVPVRMPELVMLPERTTIRLLPMEAICSLMRCWAPDPTATIAITAATPMMIPSMVSAERILLTRSARSAIFMLAKIFLVKNAPIRRAMLVVAILVIEGAFMIFPSPYRVWTSLAGNLPLFLAGLLLADWHTSGWLRPSARGALWDLVPLFAAVAVVWTQFHGEWGPLLPWVLLLGCVAAFRGRWTPRLVSLPWIATIGGMCYTIYLYHLILISILYRATIHLQTGHLGLDLLIQFAVMTPVILLVCAGFFVISERPFMRRDWPARVWATLQPAPRK